MCLSIANKYSKKITHHKKQMNAIKEAAIWIVLILSVIIAYGYLFLTGSWIGALVIVIVPIMFLLISILTKK